MLINQRIKRNQANIDSTCSWMLDHHPLENNKQQQQQQQTHRA